MVIKSYAATMINTVDRFEFIEVKMLYINLSKKCSKKLNIVRISVGISGLGFKIPGSGFYGIPTLQSRDFPGSTQ